MSHNLVIPGYDVWGLLGEGGMSDVWLAKHRALAMPVIVKTLKQSIREKMTDTQGEGTAERVSSEARLMAKVSSPRVVRALDAGQAGETPYLVQEYVDGLDLAELDRRRRTALGVGLPLWLVVFAMTEVSYALRSAHQAGVIHRDLKPSNVFAAPETGVRLGDFGLAVLRAGSASLKDSAGTLKFMAPEQLSQGSISRATDVWGAGATAFDLRYGHAPFESVEEVLDPKQPLRMPKPTSPAEAFFQELLRMMMNKSPKYRCEDLTTPLHHFTMLGKALGTPTLAVSRIDTTTLLVGSIRVKFVAGDVSTMKSDAIISSANYQLTMRSGVGNALRMRGGDEIEREAMAKGEQPLGSCLRTTPGKLDTKHVFHAVSAWNEVSTVGRAFARALLMAAEAGCTSIAVPALGTGAGRVGFEMCANAMMTTLRWQALLGGLRLKEVTVVLDSEEHRKLYQDTAEECLGLAEAGLMKAIDVGLPVDDQPISVEAPTYIDPLAASGGG